MLTAICLAFKKYISPWKHTHRDPSLSIRLLSRQVLHWYKWFFFSIQWQLRIWSQCHNWRPLYSRCSIFLSVLTFTIPHYIVVTLILWMKKLSFHEFKYFREYIQRLYLMHPIPVFMEIIFPTFYKRLRETCKINKSVGINYWCKVFQDLIIFIVQLI